MRDYDSNKLGKVFRGKKPLTKADARYLKRHWSTREYILETQKIPFEAREEMYHAFEKKGVIFDDNVDKAEVLAYYFGQILKAITGEDDSEPMVCPIDLNGDYLEQASSLSCHYNSALNRWIIGGHIIDIDPTIAPDSVSLEEEDQPYIKALLEVFSEYLGEQCVSVQRLYEYNSDLYNELMRNREYFYNAESIRHLIRDTFVNGEDYFKDYKNELYEGIVEVRHQSYSNGYDRLLAVLDKSTTVNLNGATLERLYLIRFKEKKGICHMLVDDGKITSWLKRF